MILKDLAVKDTLSEDELLGLISNFISKNKKSDIEKYGFKKMLTSGLGISPLLTDELVEKLKFGKCNH